MSKPDLTYRQDRPFTRFYAETEAGQLAWTQMATVDGCAAVFTIQLPEVLRQLRAAGYTVRKAQPIRMTDDELLEALNATP